MIKWQDVISLKEKSSHGFPTEAGNIRDFLAKVQSTPEGQQLFHDIQNKYGAGNKVDISFDNTFESRHFNYGGIHFNLQDFNSFQAKDSRTGEYEAAGLPIIVYHELTHAADPKLPIRQSERELPYEKDGPDGVSPAEAAAVKRTEAFIHRYYPQLPDWKNYNETREVGRVNYGDTIDAINNAIIDPKISNKELTNLCVLTERFRYGEVTAADVDFCQSLPQGRPANIKGK